MGHTHQNLRVLHLATSQNDGGIERYGVQLAGGLLQNEVWVRFACLPGAIVERLCRAAGIGTLPLVVRNSADPRAIRQIAGLIKSHGIDIVHVHSRRDYLPALLGVVLARGGKGRRTVRLVLHAHMLRPLGTPLGMSSRVFGRGADRVVAVSQCVRETLQAWHHFPSAFVQVLPNGVDVGRFCPMPSAAAQAWRTILRREWHLPEEALVLTMIGRLDAKGQAQLLTVVPELWEQVPMLRVVLVGSEGIPGTKQTLEDIAQSQGVSAQVVFAGPREDIPQVLAASDLVVHLPGDEAFGLVVVEAMAAGLPVVATEIGGCREIVQDTVTGYLVPLGNREALTAALQRLLLGETGAALRTQMGRAGRQRAETYFALARQIEGLQELYHELCPQ